MCYQITRISLLRHRTVNFRVDATGAIYKGVSIPRACGCTTCRDIRKRKALGDLELRRDYRLQRLA